MHSQILGAYIGVGAALFGAFIAIAVAIYANVRTKTPTWAIRYTLRGREPFEPRRRRRRQNHPYAG
ncbi:MAG TPA: hypothetical protein VGG10_05135 [Rhizomicrobium sp.]|jgi:hypothetical protein